MMLSKMYLNSLLRNCMDEYEVRSKLADAGVDYDDVSDESGRMSLQCWNEKGAWFTISFDCGEVTVKETRL